MAKDHSRLFFQRRHTDGQQGYEKKFVTNHKENINQNGNELSLHTCQNDYYRKDNK